MIYLDYAATTPMLQQALEAYGEAAQTYFGNASSLHDAGGLAHDAVKWSRQVIADKLGVHRDGIIFTGSGTEGNIIAILSLARTKKRGAHIITSEAEHTSVHAAMNTLEREGFRVTKMPLNAQGVIDLEALHKAIRADTTLISIQHVNSEIGTIQPIEEVIKLAKQHGILVHVDCVQSYCKLPVATFANQVDGLTISAHKIGGPKGCGAIYLNPYVRVEPLFPGVTHERGLRGGTLDTPSIVAMAVATKQFRYELEYQWQLREAFLTALEKIENSHTSSVQVVGGPHAQQLPNIVGLCMSGMEGQLVMLKLNEAGIYVSTGSACDIHSASGTKAILAMGKTMDEARQFFRISFGMDTTRTEVLQCAEQLAKMKSTHFYTLG